MTREEADFIGSMNMCDEISNEAYKKIMCYCEEQEPCEDCISRRAVLDMTICDGISCDECSFNICENGKSGCLLDERISKLPPVTPTQRWIPVSERLPKAGEYVDDVAKYYLVQNEYGDMLVARYTHSGYWEQIYQMKPIADEIVAWMPLPKTYKESEE